VEWQPYVTALNLGFNNGSLVLVSLSANQLITASMVGLYSCWIQLTHSLKAPLVSTLEPMKWKNRFQSLLSKRYTMPLFTTAFTFALEPDSVGLYELNPFDP
jgi:hypothetical protein